MQTGYNTTEKYPEPPKETMVDAYPIGYDHRVVALDDAARKKDELTAELDQLREARKRFDEKSDFDIRSREQTVYALGDLIDQLKRDLNEESPKATVSR